MITWFHFTKVFFLISNRSQVYFDSCVRSIKFNIRIVSCTRSDNLYIDEKKNSKKKIHNFKYTFHFFLPPARHQLKSICALDFSIDTCNVNKALFCNVSSTATVAIDYIELFHFFFFVQILFSWITNISSSSSSSS